MNEKPSSKSTAARDATLLPRVLDAAANRAGEALRVIEDYVRFALDDRHLTSLVKEIRHELCATIAVVPSRRRQMARETAADVGTRLATQREYVRGSAADVVEANFARLRESLRSLEEFSKLEHPDVARTIEQLRYRVYTLHRAVGITSDSSERLSGAQLYILIDGRESIEEFRSLAASLVGARVHMLQLREKQMEDRELLARAKALREITARTQTLFIMNDRPDLALLADADGVHIGQDELSVRDVRKILGDKLVGVSTHDIAQARQGVMDGANYIGVGPTFSSNTKAFDELAGLKLVRQVSAEISLPAFAIGGVDAENASQVIEAGLHRIAVSGTVLQAPSPARAADELLAVLAAARIESRSHDRQH